MPHLVLFPPSDVLLDSPLTQAAEAEGRWQAADPVGHAPGGTELGEEWCRERAWKGQRKGIGTEKQGLGEKEGGGI